MDDLYDNLENYYDEKIIDELKNENKELKTKLEEYSSAMTRLQMDFDKLNSEYKKLEKNYSSLLKTARAEIERKAEMIKSLNTEKDLLIIKTLQTTNKNVSNNRRFNINNTQRSKKSYEIETTPQPKPSSGNQNEENRLKNDRINSTHTQSEDTTSTLENKPNISEDEELRDTNKKLTNKIHKDVPMKSEGAKITNRRKSMPFCSNIEPIFSSDDDFEALHLKNTRKSPLREDSRQYDKYRSRDNFSSKDRFYASKTNRFTDHGKYTNDRYESSSKYTRRSAEKYRSKYTKDNSESHKSRADYTNSRQTILRSSPTDRYNRSKSRDRRTFERENYYDKQRHSPHNYDNSAVKHKIRNELEEPSSKRYKTDQNKKALIKENISNNDKETEHGLRSSFTKQDFIEPTSCQSPDYVNIESALPQQIIKEIKHTAVTLLEDPRVSSKKYVVKNNKGITVLSTVVSEDFDIKPVNVSSWEIPNIEKFMIPPTLPTERFSEETDNDFVNEIYLDIDKPLLNDSLESGEIQSLKDDEAYCTKENDRDKMHEHKKINKDHSKTLNSLTVLDSNKMNPAINKYEIPKRKKPDKITKRNKNGDFDILSTKQKSANNCCDEIKRQEVEKHDKVSTLNTENVIIEEQYQNSEVSKMNTILPENTLTAASCTLAEDLELSDEANESRDTQNDVKKSKKILPKDKLSVVSLDDKQEGDMPVVKDDNREPKEKSKPLNLKKVTKDSSRDSGKNRKTKKKTELKGANCTEAKEQNKKLQTFTKLQSKPVISIQTKHKFSDLFGDSSSLITPDDLGISTPDIKLPLTVKYASIFDNTQDAVDLSVENVNSVQSNASEVSAFPTNPEDQSNDKTSIAKAKNDAEKLVVPKDLDEIPATNCSLENNLHQKATKNDDPEIVKTVIISTGVQPKYASESNLLQGSQKCTIENTEKIINNDEASMKSCALNYINALATSTPHKTEHVDISTVVLDPVSNDASKISANINLSSNVSNASNPGEILNEADVPDVRLFVKRRRKKIKKPS
ncbi:repetitive organellar protein-like isoform X2 [Maniola jurtina]|uniref:repetitive organellar protein-like isoform X2 n=1 Tax=Maniola jurtina TaxID=191418 RepID=UPI001E68B7DE|nr:repetitive organellar protein-like isoform X2 [Maniola jurtina]